MRPGEEHITDVQAAKLQALVNEIVTLETKLKQKAKTHRSVWATLNNYCKVPSYRLIKLPAYNRAEKYLHQWIGRLNSMASAPYKAGDTWRKKRYSYIKINSKPPTEKTIIENYCLTKFGTKSLRELSNEELETVYKYVAGRKRRNK